MRANWRERRFSRPPLYIIIGHVDADTALAVGLVVARVYRVVQARGERVELGIRAVEGFRSEARGRRGNDREIETLGLADGGRRRRRR